MKFLLLIVVIAVVLWVMASRRRRDEGDKAPPPPPGKTAKDAKPLQMLACAHCGVHLPQSEAVTDADDRAYCSEAHRLAGPR